MEEGKGKDDGKWMMDDGKRRNGEGGSGGTINLFRLVNRYN
jgi:hypothetical protein